MGAEPKPGTFCQYVAAGRRLAASGEIHPVLDKIAEAILRLARIAKPTADLAPRRRGHRHVLQLLAGSESQAAYREIVACLGVGWGSPSLEEWHKDWQPRISKVVKAICGACPDNETTRSFLAWQALDQSSGGGTHGRRDNVFKYPATEPKVGIRLGSIHSVKGETHSATLILDTYYYGHHLQSLKPWLLGQRSGGASEGVRGTTRLKQHYVAMTRPTHLLCLAMRRDAFNDDEIDTLKERSWRVGHIGNRGLDRL
jgi:hypothetical protein